MTGEWQDIATAPRKQVILLFAPGEPVDAGYWVSFIGDPDCVGVWEVTGGNHWPVGMPTHWAPMPHAPSPKRAEP